VHEVARLLSPDGRLEAQLLEVNGGATSLFGYEVEVVPLGGAHGVRVASFYGATRNANAYGVTMRWRSAQMLELDYFKAEGAPIFRHSVSMGDRNLDIAVVSGVVDSSAPAGGMLWNLKKH
jgi:hypothetical protein